MLLLASLSPRLDDRRRLQDRTAPRVIALALVLLALSSAAGCMRVPYTHTDPLHFRPSAPPGVTFEALVRHADALGYRIHDVDRAHGTFLVHAQSVGRPSRSARRSSLLLVEVADREVRVSAVGRHVRRDGRMHPALADELLAFGEAMQIASDALRGGVAGAPAVPPSTYHTPPPDLEPPRFYLPPPPSRALGEPAAPTSGGATGR